MTTPVKRRADDEARIAECIRRLVEAAPPLSDAQRARLSQMLRRP